MLLLRDISSFLTANVGIFSELYKKFGKYCHYLYLCRLKMNKMDIGRLTATIRDALPSGRFRSWETMMCSV